MINQKRKRDRDEKLREWEIIKYGYASNPDFGEKRTSSSTSCQGKRKIYKIIKKN
jgi:hypothetical protein